MVRTDRVRDWAMSMLDKALRDQNRRGLGSRGGGPAASGQRPARPLAVKAGPRFEYGRQFGQSDAELKGRHVLVTGGVHGHDVALVGLTARTASAGLR
jgi:hypothetical protein